MSFVTVKHFLKEVVCSWFLKKYDYKQVSRLDGFKVNESQYKQCGVTPHFPPGKICWKKYWEKKYLQNLF